MTPEVSGTMAMFHRVFGCLLIQIKYLKVNSVFHALDFVAQEAGSFQGQFRGQSL